MHKNLTFSSQNIKSLLKWNFFAGGSLLWGCFASTTYAAHQTSSLSSLPAENGVSSYAVYEGENQKSLLDVAYPALHPATAPTTASPQIKESATSFTPSAATRTTTSIDEPDPKVLIRPKNSALPMTGVPVAPWPGLATSVIPSVNAYNGSSKHKIELDALTDGEGPSALLPRSWDALRTGDLEDPYYVPSAGAGHLLPMIMPFRERLQKQGFVFSLSYKGESMADIYGGKRRGMDYVHELTLQMNFDLDKLLGWKGWSFHTLLMNRAGRQVSYDRVGEHKILLMEVYSLSGHVVAHLVDFYAQKTFLNNKMDVIFGRMSLSHVYATSPLICTFMLICSAPVALKQDPGLAVYPKATWGARFRFRPTRDTSVMIGAYQVSPNSSNPSGWSWGSEDSTGMSIPIQFTWKPYLTRNRLVGHYVLGFDHDTSHYPDLLKSGKQFVNHNRFRAAPVDTFWFEGDQMIYRKGGRNEMAGGYLMFGYIHNTPRVVTIDDEAYGGFSFNGVIPGRLLDRLGVLYTWYHFSNRNRKGQEAALAGGASLGEDIFAPQRTAHVIEAYYSIDTGIGITVAPEFEYMIHPGAAHVIPDAALVGLKVSANL